MKKVFLVASLALIAATSCNLNRVKGNGHVVSKSYALSGFKDIDAGSVMKVYLKQGPEYSVRIDAEENLLELMQVHKSGDKLEIGFKNNTNISPTKDIKVYITAPDYHNVGGSGACDISSEGTIKGNEINLSLSGASDTHFDVEVNKLKVDASGASEIHVKGKAVYFEVDGSGDTEVRGFDLLTENTSIELSGSGNADVNVSGSLKVDISGAGSVKYKGTPSSINKDISGAGSVSKVD